MVKYMERVRRHSKPDDVDHLQTLISPDILYAFNQMWMPMPSQDSLLRYFLIWFEIISRDSSQVRPRGQLWLEELETYRVHFHCDRPILKCHEEMKARAALNDLVVMFKYYETMNE